MSDHTPTHDHLIAALLGPPGPELTCEECFEQLDRYVDVELAGADPDRAVPGMRAHLIGCPVASRRVLSAAGRGRNRCANRSSDPASPRVIRTSREAGAAAQPRLAERERARFETEALRPRARSMSPAATRAVTRASASEAE